MRSTEEAVEVSQLFATTAEQSCEELWASRTLEQAHDSLTRLRKVLLQQTRNEPIDPSATFLAIQGAALRFGSDAAPAVFLEHALWTAATLAHDHVKPLWWPQQQVRRQRVRRERVPVREDDDDDNDNDDSNVSTTLTATRQVNESGRATRFFYEPFRSGTRIHIPEVLPAAMIRFAATAAAAAASEDHSSLSMMEAQMVLVYALACPPARMETPWVLLGVRQAISNLLRTWLRFVRANISNWAFGFCVERLIVSLLKAGFQAMPELHVDMTETALLLAQSTVPCRSDIEACTCAHECMRALWCMADRSGIPVDMLGPVAHHLCAFCAYLGQRYDGDDFDSRKNDTYHIASSTLFSLLEKSRSPETVVNALLDELRGSILASTALERIDGFHRVGIVVLMLSAALWGDSCESQGMAHLRIFWHPYLVRLSALTRDQGERLLSEGCGFRDGQSSFAESIVDVILSLRILLEMQAREEVEPLTEAEWDVVIACFESSIPLLLGCAKHVDMDFAMSHVVASVRKLILQLCLLLDLYANGKRVPLMPYASVRQLCVALLQRILPTLGSADASVVGKTAVRCWIALGTFPNRVENWVGTAVEILHELFLFYEGCKHKYPMDVRQEVLELLTSEQMQHPNDDVEASQALLGFTQNMREMHIEFISSGIMPTLVKVLEDVSPELRDIGAYEEEKSIGLQAPVSMASLSRALSDSVNRKSEVHGPCSLLICVVRLAGRIYRDRTGSRALRFQSVDILREVSATRKKPPFRSSVRMAAVLQLALCLETSFQMLPQAHETVPLIVNTLGSHLMECSSSLTYNSEFSLSFRQSAAITVVALFTLSRIRIAIDGRVAFRTVRTNPSSAEAILTSFFGTIGGQSPLCRSSVVESSGSPFLVVTKPPVENFPFSGTSKTDFPVQSIIIPFATLLRAITRIRIRVDDEVYCFHLCLRVACFDILCLRAQGSVGDSIPMSVTPALFKEGTHKGEFSLLQEYDALAGCLALAGCAQNSVLFFREVIRGMHVAADDESDRISSVGDWLNLLVQSCKSEYESVSKTAFKGLTAILPGVFGLCRKARSLNLVDSLVLSLEPFFDCMKVSKWALRDDSSDFLMSQSDKRKLAALQVGHDCLICDSSCAEVSARRWMHSLYDVILEAADPAEDFFVHLALRCIPCFIGVMRADDVRHASQSVAFSRQAIANSRNFLPRLIPEILARRSFKLKCALAESLPAQPPSADPRLLTKHDELFVEAHAIAKFDVEDAQGLPFSSAYWLHKENVLLQCRLGSSRSRYRGHVEVVVRTVSARKRVVVRLMPMNTIVTPEISAYLRHCDVPHSLTIKSKPLPEAEKVLARFDEILESNSSEYPVSNMVNSSRTIGEEPSQAAHFVSSRFDNYNFVDHEGGGCIDFYEEMRVAEVEADDSKKQSGATVTGWILSVTASQEAATGLRYEITKLLAAAGAIIELSFHDDEFCPLIRDEPLERAVSILDRIPVLNCHKVALLYDRSAHANQLHVTSEETFLAATSCSPTFHKFCEGLGTLTPSSELCYYSGGLDNSYYASDGKYALVWIDEDRTKTAEATAIIVFHMVNLFPGGLMRRKRHIGNDHVLILYSDCGSNALVEYELGGRDLSQSVIGGAYGFVLIFVTSHRLNTLRIALRIRQGLPAKLRKILSDFVADIVINEDDAPMLIRNMAMRADLACRASFDTSDPPSSCLERYVLLRDMKRHAVSRTQDTSV